MHIRKPLEKELPSVKQLHVCLFVTILALVVLSVTMILPAERGIDPTGIGERLNLTRMGQIKIAMAENDAPLEGRPQNSHELTVSLQPGQGQELKLEMEKGFSARYEWQTDGIPVYHDTHGDTAEDSNVFITYSKAEAVTRDSGQIKAVYRGNHGWYWLNNSNKLVTITLKTEGEYHGIMAN